MRGNERTLIKKLFDTIVQRTAALKKKRGMVNSVLHKIHARTYGVCLTEWKHFFAFHRPYS